MAKVVPITAPPASERRKLADEWAELHEKIGPMKKRHDSLQDTIESWHLELADLAKGTAEQHAARADATGHEEGDRYVVNISARTQKTEVTGLDKLFKLLGIANFIAFTKRCGATQKALNESVQDETKREQFLETTQTGSRRFTLTKKFGAGGDAA